MNRRRFLTGLITAPVPLVLGAHMRVNGLLVPNLNLIHVRLTICGQSDFRDVIIAEIANAMWIPARLLTGAGLE